MSEMKPCWECSRGVAWKERGRATQQAKIAELARQAAQLEAEIRSIEAVIERGDAEVATHAMSCPEIRR
jgi:hypothetical protein